MRSTNTMALHQYLDEKIIIKKNEKILIPNLWSIPLGFFFSSLYRYIVPSLEFKLNFKILSEIHK